MNNVEVQDQVRESKTGKSVLFVPKAIPVRRFQTFDIPELSAWLFGRLKEFYPFLNERTFAGWLSTIINSNDFFFVRTDRTVGCLQLVSSPLDPHKDAVEVFVLTQTSEETVCEEGVALYKEFRHWAEMSNVREIIVDRCSDFSRDIIREGCGKLHPKHGYVIKVKE